MAEWYRKKHHKYREKGKGKRKKLKKETCPNGQLMQIKNTTCERAVYFLRCKENKWSNVIME